MIGKGKIMKDEFRNQIIEVFYGESSLSLADISKETGIPEEECQRQFDLLKDMQEIMAKIEEEDPSQISVNKILAHARSPEEEKVSFWKRVFQNPLPSAFGIASVLFVGFVSFSILKNEIQDTSKVATNHAESHENALNEHILTTPLDKRETTDLNSYFKRYKFYRPSTPIYNVSVGNHNQNDFWDDDLERKMMNFSLVDKDVESLFFRARKFEKSGYYKDALKDYTFITKYFPNFKNNKSIQLAMARCLEALQQNQKAIHVLEDFEKHYGSSEEIELWIDELKSETF